MGQNDLQYQQPSQILPDDLARKKNQHFPTSLAWVLKTTPKTNSNTSLSTAMAPGRCLKWLWKKSQHEDVFFDVQESDVFCTIFKAVYRVHRENVDVYVFFFFCTCPKAACYYKHRGGSVDKYKAPSPCPTQVAHNSKRVKKTERMAAAMPWRFSWIPRSGSQNKNSLSFWITKKSLIFKKKQGGLVINYYQPKEWTKKRGNCGKSLKVSPDICCILWFLPKNRVPFYKWSLLKLHKKKIYYFPFCWLLIGISL